MCSLPGEQPPGRARPQHERLFEKRHGLPGGRTGGEHNAAEAGHLKQSHRPGWLCGNCEGAQSEHDTPRARGRYN